MIYFKLITLFMILMTSLFPVGKDDISFSRENAITKAISDVSNIVVGVNVTKIKQQRMNPFFDPFWDDFFPQKRTYKVESFGSGVIISTDGYIVTNEHVVQNATEIIITMVGGEKFEAQIIGTDELTDIALLKIDKDNLPKVILGDSDNLLIGEWAIALGNPLGLFNVSNQATATVGIISGTNMDFGQKRSGRVYQNMIQTDASINEGNSGGPLINIFGEVIGINTFIMTVSNIKQGSIGIAFSIPINRVKDIIHELILYGEVKRSYSTGFKIKPMNSNVQKYLNVPFDKGAVIIDVEKKSAAMNAGLKVGDIIFKVDDIVVNSNQDFININNENLRKSGDIVILEVWRSGDFYIIELELKNYK